MALPCLLDDTRRQGNRYPDELIRCIMMIWLRVIMYVLSFLYKSSLYLYNIGADLASAFLHVFGGLSAPQAAGRLGLKCRFAATDSKEQHRLE